jgi:hypothetical protein
MGRPSRYSAQLAAAILWRLSEGELLKDIADDPDMPHQGTIHRWAEQKPDFREAYARARQRQAHVFAERAVADGLAATPETAQAQRLKFDTGRWWASKLEPRVYAEKTIHTGADGTGPVEVKLGMDYGSLDAEELLVLRQLLEKATIRRAPALVEGEASEVDGDE